MAYNSSGIGMGTANAFDAPARQAFVRKLVEPVGMTNAITLNSAMFNTTIAIGPAVGEVVYATFGPASCFTINGMSFVAVICALLLMKLKSFIQDVKKFAVGGFNLDYSY